MIQVDKPEDLKDGAVPGVKNAAVRKLAHELGIAAEDVPIDSFKFLTRLHYYAADAVTHGPNAPWGEHEIDYILFIQVTFRARIDAVSVLTTTTNMKCTGVSGRFCDWEDFFTRICDETAI